MVERHERSKRAPPGVVGAGAGKEGSVTSVHPNPVSVSCLETESCQHCFSLFVICDARYSLFYLVFEPVSVRPVLLSSVKRKSYKIHSSCLANNFQILHAGSRKGGGKKAILYALDSGRHTLLCVA